MPEIRTELEIDAPTEDLWAVLTDFASYPEWNTFLTALKGEPKVGSRVDVYVNSGLLTSVFHTTVLIADVERELRWQGHFLHDSVVSAQHYFQIESLGPSRSRFTHGEQFTGFLAPLAWAAIRRSTHRGYARMNRAFKERVEAKAGLATTTSQSA